MNHTEYMQIWRNENRERHREITKKGNKKYREIHHDNYLKSKKICYDKNGHKYRETDKKRRRNQLSQIHAFFGGKCEDCGISDIRVLQLDHINGEGSIDRKSGSFRSIAQKFHFIKNHPIEARQKFALRCANCNWKKYTDRFWEE